MGRELWAELSALVSLTDLGFSDNPDFEHPTSAVVRLHLWSALHDRPTCWACDGSNWDRLTRPRSLPSQSTMSRRLRSPEFEAFMAELARRLRRRPGMGTLFKHVDGKALPVAAHSKDRDARWGHGAGQRCRGYKLHVANDGGALPAAWRVAPMDVCEQRMARRMLAELARRGEGGGVVAADSGYNSNRLHAEARAAGFRLVAPRQKPGTGLGHRPHDPDRLRGVDGLEGPTATLGGMARRAARDRGQVERDFGNAVGFGGGLQGLPAWVRRPWRVRRWVWAKLMVNAARIRLLDRRKSRSDE